MNARSSAQSFFDALYGEDAPGYINIWRPRPSRSEWIIATEHEHVAQRCVNLAKDCDVYFGVGLRAADLGPHKRGGKDDVIALPGLYVDVDYCGTPLLEGLEGQQPDLSAARDLLDEFPLRPSIIISSGRGLHAYYLFRKLLLIGGSADRDSVDSLLRDFKATWKAIGQCGAYKVDTSAIEPARVLRVPGTINWKAGRDHPRPVQVLSLNPDVRYSRQELAEHFVEPVSKAHASSSSDCYLVGPISAAGDDAMSLPVASDSSDCYRRYVEAALETECAKVQHTEEPGRNDALNRASFSLGQLVTATWAPLSESEVVEHLLHEAESTGLLADDGLTQTLATIMSGLAAGKAQPRPQPDLKLAACATSSACSEPSATSCTDSSTPHLPTIELTNRQLRDITDDALRALQSANGDDPTTFVRSGSLVRVVVDENGRHTIEAHNVNTMRGYLARVANWQKLRKAGEGGDQVVINCAPRLDVVQDVLNQPEYAEAGIPPLRGVVSAPVLGPDRTIRYRLGYDAMTWLFIVGDEILIPDDPPTDEEVDAAKQLLLVDMLGDFPFVDEPSRAHAIALLLSPHCRPAISGPTPLYVIDAPAAGTGKSLLAEAARAVFSPSGGTMMMPGESEDEWRKRITSAVGEGTSHIALDNVQRRLHSSSLAAALTMDTWSDRLLGKNEMVHYPVRCTWIATGNNIALSEEIARRTCWIRMNANVEQPYKRAGFKHVNLVEWVKSNRAELVNALMVLVRAWLEAGCPSWEGQAPGGYAAWADTIGGILDVASIPGFLGNAEEVYERLDPDRAPWRAFVAAWAEKHGTEGVKSRDLLALHDHLELDIIADTGEHGARTRKMGKALAKHQDRVYGEWTITRSGSSRRAVLWALKPAVWQGQPANSPG
jgi:hypothetical protein